MKYTLLAMTQDILSNMSSDEINSISDTTESMQVATIIKQKYYDIVSRGDLPEHNQMFQLDPSLTATQPTMMFIPDGIGRVEWIKYFDSNVLDGFSGGSSSHDTNTDLTPPWTATSVTSNSISTGTKTFTVASGLLITAGDFAIAISGVNTMSGTVTSYTSTTLVLNITSIIGSGTFTTWVINEDETQAAPPGYLYVTMLPIKQFTDMINQFNPNDSNVESFTFSDTSNGFPGDFTFYYKNNAQPRYCCILSNFYVIFDSYDNTQDSTLQDSKTMCFGQVVPTFSMIDSFTPDLDSQQFPLLLNEAKALSFYELKQQPHAKAEQEIKRQWSTVQKNKSLNNRPSYFNELADFGRRGSSGSAWGSNISDKYTWQ